MMKRSAILALTALLPLGLFAQFDSGPSKAWSTFKLPKKTMKLDFKNANIDMVLSLFSKTSGITIVKDPNLKDPITLSTPKAVSLDEAFSILSSALSLRNYELTKDGKILVVRQKQSRQMSFDPSMFGGGSSGSTSGGGGSSQSTPVLKTYKITYASASAVARVLNDVFAQSNTGFNFGQFGGGNAGGFGGRNQGGRQQGGRGNFNFGGMQTGPSVRASADDYSNTVIVNAASKDQRQVEDLIKEIDKPAEEAVKARVYKLTYATATDLQPVIQNLLVANAPKGRGASTQTGQRSIDQQFGFFGGFFGGGNQGRNQNANVVAENRTNSLIVTTTEENQGLVDSVIKDLDTEIKVEATTFVIPLDNARADQMATLMRQAFGTRTGTNAGFNSGTQGRTTQNGNTARNNRLGTGNTGGGGGGGGGNTGPQANELYLDMDDEGNQLATNINIADAAAQFFGGGGQFGGGGGGQQRQNQGQSQGYGRNAQGRIVPVQDLTGQVTVIPDPNTNSIIVVTSPENAELIKKIIAQLDRIPEQVMIETIIVEATIGTEDKLGVEWKFAQPKAFGNTGTTGTLEGNFNLKAQNGEGFRYTITGGMLDGFINALKTDTKFHVLSTPRIFTSNNVNAEINISQRVPYVTSQRTDTNGNLTYTYAFEDVGIVLNVTPRITANGYVTMEVLQTANDLQGFTSFNAPIVNQRQADTTVAVKDGETIILGGIMRSTVTSTVKKIPLLGDIPILGELFKSTSRDKSKTELLVFLTPRVVRNPEDAAKLRKEQQQGFSKPTQEDLSKILKEGKGKEQKPPQEGGKQP